MAETLIGKRIGGLLLTEKLGEGGFGTVYRGQPDVGPQRAVKILLDPSVLDGLRAEAETLLGLRHENIVGLLQADLASDPPHMVLELIEGPTLAERTPLDFDEAKSVCRGILAGLAHAHSKGVAHLDLKPQNVILGNSGPKIADFGLARRITASRDDLEQSLGESAGGGVSGTLAYMAPEQREGQRGDERADIYSFGVLLCEVLTGKRPQPGDTLEELLGKLPPAWATTLFRRSYCRYEKRFASATEALEALTNTPTGLERGGRMFCGQCGKENDEGIKFCEGCGHRFGDSGRFPVAAAPGGSTCPYCKESVVEGAIKCKHCGERLDKAVPISARTGSGGATCSVHSTKGSAGTCVGCGNFFCEACLTQVKRKNYCSQCVTDLVEEKSRDIEKSNEQVEREKDRAAMQSSSGPNIVVTATGGGGGSSSSSSSASSSAAAAAGGFVPVATLVDSTSRFLLSPPLAAACGIVPGLGHFYMRRDAVGILFATFGLLFLCGGAFVCLAVLISVVAAHVAATAINKKGGLPVAPRWFNAPRVTRATIATTPRTTGKQTLGIIGAVGGSFLFLVIGSAIVSAAARSAQISDYTGHVAKAKAAVASRKWDEAIKEAQAALGTGVSAKGEAQALLQQAMGQKRLAVARAALEKKNWGAAYGELKRLVGGPSAPPEATKLFEEARAGYGGQLHQNIESAKQSSDFKKGLALAKTLRDVEPSPETKELLNSLLFLLIGDLTRLADEAATRGEFEDAVAKAEEARKAQPGMEAERLLRRIKGDWAHSLFREAEEARIAGRFDDALALATQAHVTQASPGSETKLHQFKERVVADLLARARARLAAGELKAAAEFVKKANLTLPGEEIHSVGQEVLQATVADMLSKAETARMSDKFKEALSLAEDAHKLLPSRTTEQAIEEAKKAWANRHLANARQAARSRDLEGALKQATEGHAVHPSAKTNKAVTTYRRAIAERDIARDRRKVQGVKSAFAGKTLVLRDPQDPRLRRVLTFSANGVKLFQSQSGTIRPVLFSEGFKQAWVVTGNGIQLTVSGTNNSDGIVTFQKVVGILDPKQKTFEGTLEGKISSPGSPDSVFPAKRVTGAAQ